MNNMKEVKSPKKPVLMYYVIIFLLVILFNSAVMPAWREQQVKEVDYSTFMNLTDEKKIDKVEVDENQILFTEKGDTKQTYKTALMNDPQLVSRLHDSGVTFTGQIVDKMNPILSILLSWVLPILIFFWIGQYMNKRFMKNMGGGPGAMQFGLGKSNAKIFVKPTDGIRFADVAGEDEAKEGLQEVVEYLHNPSKYKEIGAKMPKGILLVGPPGTGKTMLAKAVAGESNVPFFSISGSEFVEMFVGMGAAKVRDLFKQAKEKAPCIVFIDEIDAIGQKRGATSIGGNDEREQTLNQLLVEMDGFNGDEGVIVMAATNRADVLDPALLRPGRFDRKILVGAPDVKGREAILRVHARNKPLGSDVDLKEIAKQTPGFVGADLANLLNEAALLAARRNENEISAADVDEAEDRVIAGPAKRDRVVSPKERETVAYHEAGHTIVGLVLNDARVVHKVTIVPRGRAGGYAIMLPREDQMLMSKKNAEEQIAGLMGGRAAEEIIFHSQSSGASNDFEQATQIARAMVTQYGMSDKIGPVELQSSGQVFAGQGYDQAGYSEHTAALVDEEIKRILNEGHEQALHIIETHREQHKLIAEALLKYETLNEKQILSLYKTGKMPEADVEAAEDEQHAATFEESKRALERRETEKVEDEHDNDAESDHASQTPDSSASNDQNDHHDDHDNQA